MTTRVEKHGRNLHIWPEGIEQPFIVKPLPGRVGMQITETYLTSVAGGTEDVISALRIAVDGGRQNAITGRWEPLPEEEQVNYNRMGEELSLDEGESVLTPAFFWQTIVGMSGVQAWLEAGEGLVGTLKAVSVLSGRLGRFSPRTSPKASETA